MDELEFRKRVYTDPSDLDEELLDAAENNSRLRAIIENARRLDAGINDLVAGVVVPDGLKSELSGIPGSDLGEDRTEDRTRVRTEAKPDTPIKRPSAYSGLFQYFAIAASVLVVIGVGFALLYDPGPSLAELAIGEGVVNHLYGQSAEMELINDTGSWSALGSREVGTVMTHVDIELADSVARQHTVFFANPCVIFPEHASSHLMLEGGEGAVNVFIVRNSPVSQEYPIIDARFTGLVAPLDKGNLILLAEAGEDLEKVRAMFVENLEWVI